MKKEENNCEKIKKSHKSDSCQLKISGKNREPALKVLEHYKRLYPAATATDCTITNMVYLSLRHLLRTIEAEIATTNNSQTDTELQAKVLYRLLRS
jgi:hypothetical protein